MVLIELLTDVATEDMSIPPWWGVPAISAGAALFGALVGFISTMAADSRKAKREIDRRWDHTIRESATNFLVKIDTYIDWLRERQRLHGQASNEPDDESAGIRVITAKPTPREQAKAAEEDLWRTVIELDFIAPHPVTAAARNLQGLVSWSRFESSVNDYEMRTSIEDARAVFVDTVRTAIALPPAGINAERERPF
ncbi:hypothetical protein [Paeniglutamicibacter sp. NPDC091659]|uniref:hypothetical protein n=1 Tax=Paeniglutamicibacter sp. NPDC091659 TaxID=3364389 RepID=UPI00380B160D